MMRDCNRNDAGGQQKLLIVEDDIGLQSQLEWAFEAYDVIVASDPEGGAFGGTQSQSRRW